jgi:magnesium-transporting ATPase (P-type)
VTGTEVAKEAATMVLTDDNFATIVGAVGQGRTLYDNILKFVRFQPSTTIGAILTVFLAPLAGLPEPFSPLQILWINLIMDGPPAISLALDSARPGHHEGAAARAYRARLAVFAPDEDLCLRRHDDGGHAGDAALRHAKR